MKDFGKNINYLRHWPKFCVKNIYLCKKLRHIVLSSRTFGPLLGEFPLNIGIHIYFYMSVTQII